MKHWKAVLAIGCCCLAAACGDESAAQKAVRASLKDPDSAKFGKFTLAKKGNDQMACLTVNAKNSMGGYTGDREAALMKAGDEWQVITINELDHWRCVNVISGQ
jgi:hypothetical protein